jgi:hypothetical protein
MLDVIFPNAYLPPVHWWVLALHYERILLENNETYPKQTYRNRCNIYSANGLMQLNIPVRKVNGNHTCISEIQIDNSRNWQQVHWRSIESAYNKTPYFLYYKDHLKPYFESEYTSLSEFNYSLIKTCIQLLKAIEIHPEYTNHFSQPGQFADFRQLLHPKIPVEQLGFTLFPRYIQAFETRHGFMENLSIIDLLFNLGPESYRYLQKVYSLNFNVPGET